MNTEITDNGIGTVLYDGECSLCTAWARRCETLLKRHGFTVLPLQDQAGGNFDLSEMRVTTPDGTFGGADGILEIARRIWWAWPLYLLAKIPGVTPLLRLLYRWLAANRHCLGGRCRVPRKVRPQKNPDIRKTNGKERHHRHCSFFEMP